MQSAYAASLPGDGADGKRLHDTNCMGCHDTGIYTRKDPASFVVCRCSFPISSLKVGSLRPTKRARTGYENKELTTLLKYQT